MATHGIIYIQHSDLLTKRRMEQYWLASHCRQDRWMQAMKACRGCTSTQARASWRELRAVIQEVLASELVTRTWAAVACCHDRRHGSCVLEPVVLSVLANHGEARDRALQLVVCGTELPVEEGVALNRLRRLTERWTDMLLGYLAGDYDVEEFAFNAGRARDFATDLHAEQGAGAADQSWKLTVASLQAAFERSLTDASPNPDLNERIAGSILACFHREMCASRALVASHWMLRLGQITDEAASLVEDLLHLDRIPARLSLPG